MDDTTAVVQRDDVSEEWLREVERFRATLGLSADGSGGATNDTPKFSHAWVVGGKRTTTGAAVLVSDPQTPVRNPSLWMEFHVKGKTFDARGIGMPGSPGLLIGFNRRVAWGLTALGADQADLFRLETSADHPDAYRWNGQWRPMEVRTETIPVKGGPPTTLTVRNTHLGPVVSAFAFRQPGDPEVALKRVPVCETNRDTIQGVFAMMRALDAQAFHRALADWRFPSANCVYGDADGHIGYSVLGAIPVRARSAGEANGGEALPGTGDADDWQGFVPARAGAAGGKPALRFPVQRQPPTDWLVLPGWFGNEYRFDGRHDSVLAVARAVVGTGTLQPGRCPRGPLRYGQSGPTGDCPVGIAPPRDAARGVVGRIAEDLGCPGGMAGGGRQQ